MVLLWPREFTTILHDSLPQYILNDASVAVRGRGRLSWMPLTGDLSGQRQEAELSHIPQYQDPILHDQLKHTHKTQIQRLKHKHKREFSSKKQRFLISLLS